MVSIESHIQMQIAEFSAGLNKTSIKNYMMLERSIQTPLFVDW